MHSILTSWRAALAGTGSWPQDISYALFRFYCGISIAIGAGLSKVFHLIDEEGGREWSNLAFGVPDWFITQVSDIGFAFPSPVFWAYLAVYGEFIGGLLVAIGLFTRLSAFQLAFQFFVVSFIWYDEPGLLDMYYQQLIFWSFAVITGMGGGRISLDRWRAGRKAPLLPKAAVAGMLFLLPVAIFAQNPAPRVAFTLVNPGISIRQVDIRYIDPETGQRAGYGYDLGGLASHAVNMPVGTRLYLKKQGQWTLFRLIGPQEEGAEVSVSESEELSREEWLWVKVCEQAEQTGQTLEARLGDDLEAKAKALGIPMVTMWVSGKTPFSREVIVRAELPFDADAGTVGFCQRLNWFSNLAVTYPLGTRLYLCEAPYWEGKTVPEKLILEMNEDSGSGVFRF